MPKIEVDIKQLFAAGAHFGHKTSRWHPKMAPYIHSKREGSHIIDLAKTVVNLQDALALIEKTVSEGKSVLLVGTKKQAKPIVVKLAEETGMPFVAQRWVGGMLTNRNTIDGRIKHLKNLEQKQESGEIASKYNKLEQQRYQEEIDYMNNMYSGIKNMAGRPALMFVFDILHDANAVREAKKLNIPVVALVDTNADPSLINHPIPCNDDATKTLQLIADYLKQAVINGKAKVKSETPKEPAKKSE